MAISKLKQGATAAKTVLTSSGRQRLLAQVAKSPVFSKTTTQSASRVAAKDSLRIAAGKADEGALTVAKSTRRAPKPLPKPPGFQSVRPPNFSTATRNQVLSKLSTSGKSVFNRLRNFASVHRNGILLATGVGTGAVGFGMLIALIVEKSGISEKAEFGIQTNQVDLCKTLGPNPKITDFTEDQMEFLKSIKVNTQAELDKFWPTFCELPEDERTMAYGVEVMCYKLKNGKANLRLEDLTEQDKLALNIETERDLQLFMTELCALPIQEKTKLGMQVVAESIEEAEAEANTEPTWWEKFGIWVIVSILILVLVIGIVIIMVLAKKKNAGASTSSLIGFGYGKSLDLFKQMVDNIAGYRIGY